MTCLYTSGTNELLLPEGVTSVTVTAIGGRGGDFTYPDYDEASGAGGRSAEVTGTVAVPAGARTVYAVVGGNGTSTEYGTDPTGGAGGANGGGTGGTTDSGGPDYPGAGGGGASDIRTAPGDLESRLVVAAGGGGGINYSPGGDAGAPGQSLLRDDPAQAGTGTAGGAGGSTNPDGWSGSNGSLGVGGDGGPRTSVPSFFTALSGGGGGAGLYGGGGGSIYGSGAGGSSLAPAGTTLSLSDASPSVTITYQPPTVTPPQPPTCTGSACLPTGMFGSS